MAGYTGFLLTCFSGSFKPTASSCQPSQSSQSSSSLRQPTSKASQPSSSLRQPTSRASQPNRINPPSDKDQFSSMPSSTAVACKFFGILSLFITDNLLATQNIQHDDSAPNLPTQLPPPVKRGRGRPRKILPPDAPGVQEKAKGKRGRPPKKRPLETSLSEEKHPKKKKA